MASAPQQHEIIIAESGDVRVVRKSNDEIGYKIKSGHLSLVARKMLNVLVWHAQEMRDEEDEHGRWGMPVAKLIKDAKFNSRNYDLLREALDELQEVRIIRPARGGGITSEVMIPSYTLDNIVHEGNEGLERGQKRRGGELWLWFMLPPELKSQLLDPNQYTRLPITIMATLKTVPGLALYEICRRYATNPGGVTNRDDWQAWWRILTGATPDAEPPEYKYAKRDAFKRGVEEINKLTDIEVELIEFKSGKFVRQIQFGVRMKQQSSLDMGPPPIDTGILSRITALGLSISDAERMTARHQESDLVATLGLVEQRIKHPTLPIIESPAAYFRKALRDGYAESAKAEKKPLLTAGGLMPEVKAEPDSNSELIARRQAALDSFDAMTEEGRAGVLGKFAADNPALSASVRKNSGGKTVRNALAGWLLRSSGK